MRTPQWIKKLGGHAAELYVAAELSKRGIPNSLLPENFSDDDIIVGTKDGSKIAYIQVKSCHPDRANSFILRETNEEWVNSPSNQFVAFVRLGSPRRNEPPKYWIATKRETWGGHVSSTRHTVLRTGNADSHRTVSIPNGRTTGLLLRSFCSQVHS